MNASPVEHLLPYIVGIVGSILSFILGYKRIPAQDKKVEAQAREIDAKTQDQKVDTALDIAHASSEFLSRYDILFNTLMERDKKILDLSTDLTSVQAEVARLGVCMDGLNVEVEKRDRVIAELKAELEAERRLRKQYERRLAEIDPEFSIKETTNQ